MPSTLIELSSAVGVMPFMTISFAPGSIEVRLIEIFFENFTHTKRHILNISNDLGSCRVQGHTLCRKISYSKFLFQAFGVCHIESYSSPNGHSLISSKRMEMLFKILKGQMRIV